MKIDPDKSAAAARAPTGTGRGFDALMAQMERELWAGAAGGVVAGACTAATSGEPPWPMTTDAQAAAVPGRDGSLARVVPTAAPHADDAGARSGTGRAAIAVAALAPAGPAVPAAVGAAMVGDRAPPRWPSIGEATTASAASAAPSQRTLFPPSPGRVRLHWHATGGVVVRLQLPPVDGDSNESQVIQAVLDHLRSRGVRIHAVTVNGLRYPPNQPQDALHAD
jgi:hypothetical protein